MASEGGALGGQIAVMRARLAAAGVPDAADAARRLAAGGLGVSRGALIGAEDRILPDATRARLDAATTRLAAGEAETRILGRRGFHAFETPAHPAVLDPRPDSETLIDALRMEPVTRIVDLGCGSGCLLAAALLDHPAATGTGVERAPDAAAYAGMLLRSLGLAERARIVIGDAGRPDVWAQGDCDAALANPPYLTRAEVAAAPRAVSEGDPRAALDGGEDGLDGHRVFAPGLRAALRPGGCAFVEIGARQAATAAAVYARSGFAVEATLADLAGHPRALKLRAPGDALRNMLEGRANSGLG